MPERSTATAEPLGDLVTESRYAVDIASTVKQAEESLVEERYDGLNLDMELPDGTGLKAAQFAKKTRNFSTPVMAVSAYHNPLSKPATEIFFSALNKPVTLDRMCATSSVLQGGEDVKS